MRPSDSARDRLLGIAFAALQTRLAKRLRLVRHHAAVRRYALFRTEFYDVSQASPLYWIALQMRGDPDAERHLATGLRSLVAHTRPPDHNAGFRALFLLAYWHFWGRSLQPDTQRLLKDAIRAAIETCRNRERRVCYIEVAYTNFWMIETAVHCLGGELLGDATLRRKGMAMLRTMARYLRRIDAMDEFFSPTYIVVDLVAAAILRSAAPRGEVRTLATALERHFLRHLERHCDFAGHRWFGPYSRAYPRDLQQDGSLLNLFMFRVTGDARWMHTGRHGEGEWGTIIGMLQFLPVRPARVKCGTQTRATALLHPRSPHEQKRCDLTVYHGAHVRLASASAYREWEQTYPLTVHGGEGTILYKSLTMGHFVSAQDGGLALASECPVCTLGCGGRDDMLQNTVRRIGFEFICEPRRSVRAITRLDVDGRCWVRIRVGGVDVYVCPVFPGEALPLRVLRSTNTVRLRWSREWAHPQRADPEFLSGYACAFCVWVDESGRRMGLPRGLPHLVIESRDKERQLVASLGGHTTRLALLTRARAADYWSSSGWACRD